MLRPLTSAEEALYAQHCAEQRRRYLAQQDALRRGDIPAETPWLIAVSNTNCEPRATQGLNDRGFEVFYPERSVEVRVGPSRARVIRRFPAYPGYLFVRHANPHAWSTMIGVDGLRAIVMAERGGEVLRRDGSMAWAEDRRLGPAEVTAFEAERIRAFHAQPDMPVVEDVFRVGDTLMVTEGPFANFTGFVEEVLEGKGRLKVAVWIFGRSTPVELDKGQVDRAA